DKSYYFSNDEDDEFSHSHHLLPLFWCNNKETLILSIDDEIIEENCGACWHNTIGTTYYFCNDCDRWYHKECVESPPTFKSPYHPKHSLQLYIFDNNSRLIPYWLGLPLIYLKPPLITNHKRHQHTLYFFPRKSILRCDVCGLDDNKSFIFVCLHCDFIVHRHCIYLPYVIKISRHKHRVSFVYSLPSQEWSCGVCRQKIDETYGAYSCKMKDCIYAVHSKCATRPTLWDRKELEEEPEEVNESIKPPFEEMTDGTIVHFSHPKHAMRLEEDAKIWDDGKRYCQACILPLYNGKAYTCIRMDCDYILHEACAYLPCVIHHALHFHPLTLEPSFTHTKRWCDLCPRDSFGFKYVCYNGCKFLSFDVRCASISDPYVHHSHMHPLLITSNENYRDRCSICDGKARATLNCDKCGFVLCFGCATLPHKVRYKNDEHLLTLLYEKLSNGIYWCDLCEGTIGPSTGFYRYNECEVTLHIDCLLGADIFMNPGSRIKLGKEEFNVVQNNALTRPICSGCRRRCEYRIMFIAYFGEIYCSLRDIYFYHFKFGELNLNLFI
ncbi:hypothetical protein EUTSA_v10000530mg, partial [Eutrema salsugineum]